MAKNCRRWREEAAWLWDDDISEMIVVAFRNAWDAGYNVARDNLASGENMQGARDGDDS